MGHVEDDPMTRSLEDVQDEILDRLHAGESIDRAGLLREHPEHRSDLEAFFDLVEVVEAPPEPEEAMPARLGEFRIVREIGRGGMGVVYEAEQPSLKRRVALKVLPPALRGDRARLTRFKREAEAAARLRHPNIVPVFSFGESAGTPFFTIKLVDGSSLAEIVADRRNGLSRHWPEVGGASWRRAVETVAKVGEALAYAHGRGILHRDVKPGNVLIERDGTPRLTDFGLALDLEAQSLTVSGEVFGSPRYMSPEQAFRREKPLDARTDVYSLGVTLYELLTLELPYRGTTQNDVLSGLSSGDTVPLRELDGTLPAELEGVLARALENDPEARYSDAASFASDLRSVLAGTAPNAVRRPRVAVQEPRAPREKRSRGPVMVVLTVLGCMGFFAVASALFMALTMGSSQTPEAHAVPPSRAPARRVPTAQTVVSIARGVLPGGDRVLMDWIDPSIRLRSVVARNAPAVCRMGVRIELPPEGLTIPLTVVPIWEYRLNDDDWSYVGLDVQRFDLLGSGEVVYLMTHDLKAALGEHLADRSAHIDYRLRLKLLERPEKWAGRASISHAEAEQPHAPDLGMRQVNGTEAIWVFERRALILYDEYPDDYPEPVFDAAVDARMLNALTPRRITNEGLSQRSILLGFHYEHDQAERPWPAAFKVHLAPEGGGAGIAVAELSLPSTAAPAPGEKKTSMTIVSFQLSEEPTEQERRFLLDYQSGKLETVRLHFRPSRLVALEEPDFDMFWDREIVTNVPFAAQE